MKPTKQNIMSTQIKIPKLDAYGFISNLDGCTFAYGEHMNTLEIKPPEGGRIGLNIGNKLKKAFDLLEAHEALATVAKLLELQEVLLEGSAAKRYPETVKALIAIYEAHTRIEILKKDLGYK